MRVFPSLRIGELEINPPIIQGGMGVRVSLSKLASAVANQRCAGVIACAGIGKFMENPQLTFSEVNEIALRREIRNARKLSSGILGVNVMVALSDYDNLVAVAVEEGVDIVISGAGLPLNLPQYARSSKVKLIPIVSSARAFKIICSKWQRTYNRLPDAVIVEGYKAGGHLGYTFEQVVNGTADSLEKIIDDVLSLANRFTPAIPVIAAGGIYDGRDIAHFLERGASGVQMATRFVCTHECDVHEDFKQAYINAEKEDIAVIQSPVGLPGKVIRNAFVDRILAGDTLPYRCKYQCLKSCNSKNAPYCIAEVLSNASQGKLDNAFVFAGSNVDRCREIVSVQSLIEQLTDEYRDAVTLPVYN